MQPGDWGVLWGFYNTVENTDVQSWCSFTVNIVEKIKEAAVCLWWKWVNWHHLHWQFASFTPKPNLVPWEQSQHKDTVVGSGRQWLLKFFYPLNFYQGWFGQVSCSVVKLPSLVLHFFPPFSLLNTCFFSPSRTSRWFPVICRSFCSLGCYATKCILSASFLHCIPFPFNNSK